MIVVDRGCSGTKSTPITERPGPLAAIHDHEVSRTRGGAEPAAIMKNGAGGAVLTALR
jgi:hypothetical protein